MGRRSLQRKSIWDPLQLLQAFSENGIRPLHAQKIWSYLIRHPSAHWNDVPDLPKAAQLLLNEQFSKFTTKVVACQTSADGETTKLLLELQDGMQMEAVIMHYDTTGRFTCEDGGPEEEPAGSSAASCADSTATGCTVSGRGHRRATLCVSSQVGCQMGCTFCATGTMGLKGNLTAGEIVEQLVHANAISKIRNIVFMGMGEPLNNYKAVRAAITSIVDPRLWGLARSRVTVSTVGVVNQVKQLGLDLPGIGLALSLHAPNQELRTQIVPSAKAYHIDKLIESVAAYQHLSKQHIFVEYVLLAGVNDGTEHAHQLGKLLSGLKVLLNLIPWNPVLAAKEAHNYSAPTQEAIACFQDIVRTHYKLPTTVRQEKGQDISGACGQLALEKAQERGQNGKLLTQPHRSKEVAVRAGGKAAAVEAETQQCEGSRQDLESRSKAGAALQEEGGQGGGVLLPVQQGGSAEGVPTRGGVFGGMGGLLGGVVNMLGGLVSSRAKEVSEGVGVASHEEANNVSCVEGAGNGGGSGSGLPQGGDASCGGAGCDSSSGCGEKKAERKGAGGGGEGCGSLSSEADCQHSSTEGLESRTRVEESTAIMGATNLRDIEEFSR